jgi:hypothetical protein
LCLDIDQHTADIFEWHMLKRVNTHRATCNFGALACAVVFKVNK